MAVISLKLSEDLDAQLTEQVMEGSASPSAVDLLADLVGCCEGGPADLSSNPVHLFAEAFGFLSFIGFAIDRSRSCAIAVCASGADRCCQLTVQAR